MAGDSKNIFEGTTIVFGTSSWTSEVLGIDWSGISRPAITFKHATPTTAAATNFGTVIKKPGLNVDAGTVAVRVNFDPDQTPPMAALTETITITFPQITGDASAASWAFSGFATEFTLAGEVEGQYEGTLTLAVADEVTVTEAA